ncbi:MAG: flagellar biosynthesis protein FlhB [Clostridiales bacterium]|jgi:flagellar biosynthetic protein FlhB|nr:flagellar biosynthesis protein FlhB [Clostridiales bacterium]
MIREFNETLTCSRGAGLCRRPHIPLNLRFFDDSEKTEQPTAKKRGKARSEGQVPKSQELSTALLIIAAFFGLKLFVGGMYNRLMDIMHYDFNLLGEAGEVFDMNFIISLTNHFFLQAMLTAAPIMAVTLIIGVLSNLLQFKWEVTTKPLMPKFSKLNPIAGFKRLFKPRALLDLLKSLAKFAIIAMLIYSMFTDEAEKIPTLMEIDVLEGLLYVGNLIISLGLNVGMLFLFIALVDVIYTRYKFTKDLKMTKQEVKEEHKQAEGDPKVKAKIRQKMREISMRRMMQAVPNADVIITNPTHYAVALQYDKDKSFAPVVVAKGVDYVAKKIKEIAAENDVEVVEDKHLARTLYSAVDIGREIPPDLYQAVAEVLAFVYKLKHKVG